MRPMRGEGTKTLSSSSCLHVVGNKSYVWLIASYKHLGGHVTVSANLIHDAKHKASSAMSAYCPLLFGFSGPASLVWTRLHYMVSLVLSRLLHNVHTMVVNPKPMSTLNIVYMRVLRCIANRQRFDSTRETSDAEVRQMWGQPSLDCLMQKSALCTWLG